MFRRLRSCAHFARRGGLDGSSARGEADPILSANPEALERCRPSQRLSRPLGSGRGANAAQSSMRRRRARRGLTRSATRLFSHFVRRANAVSLAALLGVWLFALGCSGNTSMSTDSGPSDIDAASAHDAGADDSAHDDAARDAAAIGSDAGDDAGSDVDVGGAGLDASILSPDASDGAAMAPDAATGAADATLDAGSDVGSDASDPVSRCEAGCADFEACMVLPCGVDCTTAEGQCFGACVQRVPCWDIRNRAAICASMCGGTCGDFTCNAAGGETCTNCSYDCGPCP